MNPTAPNAKHQAREGFVLFYVMGTVALLTLAAMITLSSTRLEMRTAHNHLNITRALYHAEAGVKMVQRAVEQSLARGISLEETLETLRVEPPPGIGFDPIDTFREIVPERLFSFEVIGRSQQAMVSVVVQFRRRPLLSAGMFGADLVRTQPNVMIFGYDSRVVLFPTAADSNAGASIGSNQGVDLGQNVILDGVILLGETETGLVASCSRCDHFVQVEIGFQDPDPLGLLDGGSLAQVFAGIIDHNDNSRAPGVIIYDHISGTGTLTLTAGDYFVSGVYLGPNTTLVIDDREGPVRLFLDGSFVMQPNSDLIVKTSQPFGFQLYSISNEDITLRPKGSSAAYVYAPGAKLFLLPNQDAKGAYWAREIRVQPGGSIFLDTSLSEKMLSNNLEIHAWYEQQLN